MRPTWYLKPAHLRDSSKAHGILSGYHCWLFRAQGLFSHKVMDPARTGSFPLRQPVFFWPRVCLEMSFGPAIEALQLRTLPYPTVAELVSKMKDRNPLTLPSPFLTCKVYYGATSCFPWGCKRGGSSASLAPFWCFSRSCAPQVHWLSM